MGHRYLTLWAAYADVFGLPARLDGLDVLDVGAATGASSLLFAALGAARVAAPESTTGASSLEENARGARGGILAAALGLERVVEPLAASLYAPGLFDDASSPHYGAFDVVVCSGVLYHVTDCVDSKPSTRLQCHGPAPRAPPPPQRARPGGLLLLETAATSERAAPGGAVVAYWGAGEPGYNYFRPEPRALARLLADAGFADVHVTDEAPRILAAARRPDACADFLRAGFSRPGYQAAQALAQASSYGGGDAKLGAKARAAYARSGARDPARDASARAATSPWLNPNMRHGRWSEEEHKQFLDLMTKYGRSWTRISQVMMARGAAVGSKM
ncbi:methyltransferase [Aureococcus anophagefferens]|nr:methyltransferase [Aureococcus anophagefferens]